jgi:hypothetical protein
MKRAILVVSVLMLAIGAAAIAQDTSSKTTTPATTTAAQSKPANSDTDIAAAKAAHKVWVNLDTGIYHKGGRWYGKTKNGKFMTEDDAKKAGYKAAKRD